MDPGPSPRLAALFAAIALVLFTWPALPSLGSALLGHPFGEVDNHFWMATFGGRADAPARNLPLGFDLPLIDPVHLLWWVPGAIFGPVFAYNVAILADLALAALGGWLLSRELGASRGGALVGMVATAFSPFLGGMIEFGITEAWPVGWLALHAALLLRFGRTGRVADALGAAAALGAFLLSGWYHVAFALVAEVGLAAWALRRGPRVRTLVGVVLQGVVAALPLVPLWAHTQARAAIWSPRLSALTRPEAYADWAAHPRFGTDLLNFFTPRLDGMDVPRTVYLGLAALALAVLGVAPVLGGGAVLAATPATGATPALGVAPTLGATPTGATPAVGATPKVGATPRSAADHALARSARAALLVAAPLWILALGHWLRVAGQPVDALGPLPAGHLVDLVPAARGLSHWYRAAGPATVFLAAAAALGATRLLARAPARHARTAALALGGLVLVDAIALSPVPWPRVAYTPDPPAELLALPKPGALLQLPFDEGRGLTGIASRRVYDQWQVYHRRGITEHYEGRDALLQVNALAAQWQRACAGVGPRIPSHGTPEDELTRIQAVGVAYVVVHPAYAKPGCVQAVGQRLGEPVTRTLHAVVWDVEAALDALRREHEARPAHR